MTPSRGSGVLVAKLLVGGVVAAVVGGVAALSGVGGVLVVVAVVAAVGAFWLFDALLVPTPDHSLGFVPGASGSPLPATPTGPIPPPGGVETAPTNAERSDDGPGDQGPHGARLDPGLFDQRSVEIKQSSQRSGRAFSIRIAKHGHSIEECEDAVAVDPRRAVLAVADGASSSFGANLWAGTLADHFVEQPPEPLSVAAFADVARRRASRHAATRRGDRGCRGGPAHGLVE